MNEIGKVSGVVGNVYLVTDNGETALREGAMINQNDVVRTESGAQLTVTFSNGKTFTLGEQNDAILNMNIVENIDSEESRVVVDAAELDAMMLAVQALQDSDVREAAAILAGNQAENSEEGTGEGSSEEVVGALTAEQIQAALEAGADLDDLGATAAGLTNIELWQIVSQGYGNDYRAEFSPISGNDAYQNVLNLLTENATSLLSGGADAIDTTQTINTSILQQATEIILEILNGDSTEDNYAPLAGSGSASVSEDDSFGGTVYALDIEGDAITYSLLSSITEGTLSFDPSTGAFVYNPDSAFEYLQEGESADVSFTFRASDGDSFSNTATITITVLGANDIAEISGDMTGSVTEDSDVSDGELVVEGQLSVTDADHDQSAFTAQTITGTYGTLVIDADGGWTYAADNSLEAIQALSDGDTLTETITVTSVDGTEQDIAITINGTNDGLEIIDGTDSISVDMDDPDMIHEDEEGIKYFTLDLAEMFENPENIDIQNLNIGTTDGHTESVTYSLDGTLLSIPINYEDQFAYMPEGSENTLNITFDAEDTQSGEMSEGLSLNVTLTGTNDVPVAEVDTGATDEDTAITVDVLENDSDVDTTAVLTLAGVQIVDESGEPVSGQGSVSIENNKLVFDPGSDFDDLSEGETQTVTVSYTISDEYDETATASVQITVTGTEDGPVSEPNEAPEISIETASVTAGDGESALGTFDQNIIAGDGGAVSEASGLDMNFDVPSTMTITFSAEYAGHNNVFGYYTMDADGNPQNPTILLANTNDDGTSLDSGDMIATVSGVEGEVVFFLIDQGYDNYIATGTLNNANLTFDTDGNLAVDNGDETLTTLSGVRYSDSDGKSYVHAGTVEGSDEVMIGFEDLKNGDDDYDDFVFTVDYGADTGDNGEVFSDISISDIDDDNMESVTVTVENPEAGDILAINGTLPDGITAQYTESEGVLMLVLSGTASKSDYESALEMVTLNNDDPESAFREVSVQANDGDDSSNIATIKVSLVDGSADTTASDAPVITNIIDHDGDNDFASMTLYGTGEPGETITLYSREGTTSNGNDTNSIQPDNFVAVASATVDQNGNWSVDLSSLSSTVLNDNEFFQATQTDAAGNTSALSNTAHFWHGTWSNASTESGDDYVMMGAGNDKITINDDDSNDQLVVDGGLGTDTATFDFDYPGVDKVTLNDSGEIVITESNGDINILRNIEVFEFADVTLSAETLFEHYEITEIPEQGSLYLDGELLAVGSVVENPAAIEFVWNDTPDTLLIGSRDDTASGWGDVNADGSMMINEADLTVSIAGYKDFNSLSDRGTQLTLNVDDDNIGNHEGVGLGVAGIGDSDQIDKGETVVIDLNGQEINGAEIGLAGLGGNFVSTHSADATASWVAYKDGEIVAEGEVRRDFADVDGDGNLNTNVLSIDVAFDQLVFSVDANQNSNFTIQYMDFEYAPSDSYSYATFIGNEMQGEEQTVTLSNYTPEAQDSTQSVDVAFTLDQFVSDVEDDAAETGTTIRIDTLPENGTLYTVIGGVQTAVVAGQEIADVTTLKYEVDPTFAGTEESVLMGARDTSITNWETNENGVIQFEDGDFTATITGYKNFTDINNPGTQASLKVDDDNINNHEGVGLGVTGIGDNDQIDLGEAVVIEFGQTVNGAEIGLAGLGGNFQASNSANATADWKAYDADGNLVASGSVRQDTDGSAETNTISIEVPFATLVFDVSANHNSNYTIQYIDAEYTSTGDSFTYTAIDADGNTSESATVSFDIPVTETTASYPITFYANNTDDYNHSAEDTRVTFSQDDMVTPSSDGNVDVLYGEGSTATIELDGAWNSVKNARAEAEGPVDLTMKNFVYAEVEVSGGDNSIHIIDAKRGDITTGDGDDTITVEASTNGSGWSNTFYIDAGEGNNTIMLQGDEGHTVFDITTGDGDDTVSLSGDYDSATLRLGEGDNSVSFDKNQSDYTITEDGDDVIVTADGQTVTMSGADTLNFGDGSSIDLATYFELEETSEAYVVEIGNTDSVTDWDNLDSTGDAVKVTAFNADGSTGSIYVENGSLKMGVSGSPRSGHPVSSQIEYDDESGQSESLLFEFNGNMNTATVQLTNLFASEHSGEVAKWVAMFDGVEVASGVVDTHSGSNPLIQIDTTDGIVFNQISFEALDYESGNASEGGDDSSDFFVQSITGSGLAEYNVDGYQPPVGVEVVGDGSDNVTYTDTVLGTGDGDDITVKNVNNGGLVDAKEGDDTITIEGKINSGGTVDGGEGDDTLILSSSEVLNFDALKERIENIETLQFSDAHAFDSELGTFDNGKGNELTITADDILEINTDGHLDIDLGGGNTISLEVDKDNDNALTVTKTEAGVDGSESTVLSTDAGSVNLEIDNSTVDIIVQSTNG